MRYYMLVRHPIQYIIPCVVGLLYHSILNVASTKELIDTIVLTFGAKEFQRTWVRGQLSPTQRTYGRPCFNTNDPASPSTMYTKLILPSPTSRHVQEDEASFVPAIFTSSGFDATYSMAESAVKALKLGDWALGGAAMPFPTSVLPKNSAISINRTSELDGCRSL